MMKNLFKYIFGDKDLRASKEELIDLIHRQSKLINDMSLAIKEREEQVNSLMKSLEQGGEAIRYANELLKESIVLNNKDLRKK